MLLTAQTRGFLAPNRGTINQQADFSSPGRTTKGTLRGSFLLHIRTRNRGFSAPNRGTINQQADFSSPGSTTKGTLRGSFFVVQRLVTEIFFVNFTFFGEKMHKYLRE